MTFHRIMNRIKSTPGAADGLILAGNHLMKPGRLATRVTEACVIVAASIDAARHKPDAIHLPPDPASRDAR